MTVRLSQTMTAKQEALEPAVVDPESKRQEFSNALFSTLAPAVRQCDEVVRGVFQSQNKVLTEIANLQQSMFSIKYTINI